MKKQNQQSQQLSQEELRIYNNLKTSMVVTAGVGGAIGIFLYYINQSTVAFLFL